MLRRSAKTRHGSTRRVLAALFPAVRGERGLACGDRSSESEKFTPSKEDLRYRIETIEWHTNCLSHGRTSEALADAH